VTVNSLAQLSQVTLASECGTAGIYDISTAYWPSCDTIQTNI